MKELNLNKIKHVHFIGIGGIGVSAIARMFLLEGKKVTGSDLNKTLVTDELEKSGVQIFYTQQTSNITDTVDLVVYTVAIPDLNLELFEARRLGITTLSYPEMLGVISKEKYTIAVSGTHGKTTTTAMIAQVLMDVGLDPTVIVGSFLLGAKSNFIAGKSKYFVVEACEYKRSFLNLQPNIVVVTNIDDDHLDYYKDTADIQSAFHELVLKLKPEDYLICEPKNDNVNPIISDVKATVLDYTLNGFEGITLSGAHNKKNAASALVVASLLGIPAERAISSINAFKGTWRRFEYKGITRAGAMVYDDYAHHPTEIQATLAMAREIFPDKKITAVFQPHLYSRTKIHFEEFVGAFANADSVIFSPIYAAREPFDSSISSDMLAARLSQIRPDTVEAVSSFEQILIKLNELDQDNIIIVMGAGDITKVADMLIV